MENLGNKNKLQGSLKQFKIKFFRRISFQLIYKDFKKVKFIYGKNLRNNKQAHITNRNIKIHSLKILHWNKGNSLFINKIDDINFILDKYKPHLCQFQKLTMIIYNNYEFQNIK